VVDNVLLLDYNPVLSYGLLGQQNRLNRKWRRRNFNRGTF